jgi:dolichol-phosphate mannosyltransferase
MAFETYLHSRAKKRRRDRAFRVTASPPLGDKTLIVTPTYNERRNLEAHIAAIHARAPLAHVLVVDDASPDGTGEFAETLAERDARVRVLRRPGKLGLGTAYVQGFQRALSQDYAFFFEMDADLSHNAEHLPSFFAALAAGADVVVGSRNVPGGSVEGWGLGRHVLSKGGSLYSRIILGVDVRDLTTGFKAFTRRALESIHLERIASNGYAFQIEMTYRALRRGLRVVEVPIVFVDRRVGQSKMDSRIFTEAIGAVWKLRMNALLKKL